MKLKNLIIFIIIILLLIIGILIYGKVNLKHINYKEYIENSKYERSESNEYKEYFPELNDFFIDEKASDVNELIQYSDYVVIGKVKKEPILYGKSIINQFEIENVIKGNLKTKKTIKVYDLLFDWNLNLTSYLSGLTPVKKGESYILFLKKSHNPTMKNTYVYSSLQYGHVNKSHNKVLKEYSNYSNKISEILNYDYVFLEKTNKNEIEKYEKMRNEIIEYMKKNL